MCGILGFSSGAIGQDVLEQLRRGLNTLAHRGPDNASEYTDGSVYLGHRRLSIIDLSSNANQPFRSSQRQAWIIFNGEIYNYKELTAEVSGLTTTSDTEVILEGYLQRGKDFFKKLRGIYAFAIYDCRSEPQLILLRDPAGIKPLYYSLGSSFAFASEIKALTGFQKSLTINEPILKTYLSLGYCLEPSTIYNEILAAVPGEFMQYSVLTGKLKCEPLLTYDFISLNDSDFLTNKVRTRGLLSNAVNRNLTADVPVSFSVSGGIDSSLVFALGQSNSEGICIKFGDRDYDESALAEAYATILQRRLHIEPADAHASLTLVDKLFLHFDQPYADSSAIPFYILSKTAAKTTKVLIGGDGGDEIHNGYPSFQWLSAVYNYREVAGLMTSLVPDFAPANVRRLASRIHDLSCNSQAEDIICDWGAWIPPRSSYKGNSPFLFDPGIIYSVYRNSYGAVPGENFQQALTRNYFRKRMLSDYLRKADMMSMINSLEYRVPMLDEDLVQHSLSIAPSQKSDRRTTKKMLRAIHSEIFSSMGSYGRKQGFGIPMDQWLPHEAFDQMRTAILTRDSIVTEYIRRDYIELLFEAVAGSSRRSIVSRGAAYQRVLMLYVLQIWYSNTYKKRSFDL